MSEYSEKRRRIKQAHREEREDAHRIQSKEQLERIARKRFQTVFVGAVATIEKGYGHLWGEHLDKDEEDMTEEELKMFDIFLRIRDAIFDQGNDQANKFSRDLERFETSRVRYNSEIRQPDIEEREDSGGFRPGR
jgi:hypothetical protein